MDTKYFVLGQYWWIRPYSCSIKFELSETIASPTSRRMDFKTLRWSIYLNPIQHKS